MRPGLVDGEKRNRHQNERKSMTSLKNTLLFFILYVSMITGLTYAQPTIPIKNVQKNLPVLVKIQINKLYSKDPMECGEAAKQLGKMGKRSSPAIPFLIDMLNDTVHFIQEKDSEKIILSSPAKEAQSALVRIGSPSVKPLIAALKSKNRDTRKLAVEALSMINDPRAFEALISALKDENSDVRKHAAEALGDIKDARAMKPLIASLHDKKSVVRYTAHEALITIIKELKEQQAEKQLVDMLKYKDLSIQQVVIKALGNIPETRVAENLVPFLGNTNQDIRKNTAEALRKIGKVATKPLIKMQKSDDIQIRIITTMILGDIKDTLSLEPLIETLKYRSQTSSIETDKLRLEAARAIGKIRDARAVEPLIAALNDKNINVTERSAEALTAIGEPAVEPLIKVLKNDQIGLQTVAAMILGDIKDPRAVEPLIQTLLIDASENRSWYFRFEAARALGKIKDPRAIKPLEILLEDRDSSVSNIAEWSLIEITGKDYERKKKKESFWDELF
jgi:HEAT repeat protein